MELSNSSLSLLCVILYFNIRISAVISLKIYNIQHGPFTNRIVKSPPYQDRWQFSITELHTDTVKYIYNYLYYTAASALRHVSTRPSMYLVQDVTVYL